MAATIDTSTNMGVGENGHAEHKWSNNSNIQEQIVQYNFQLVRNTTGEHTTILRNMLTLLKDSPNPKYLAILYKVIGYTRDIIDGKGEYKLAYDMVIVWNEFYPELAEHAITCFVQSTEHPYGSWKDLKYLCKLCNDSNTGANLIAHSVKLLNAQLRRDYASMISNSDDISLAAKWAPREKSAFGWLYDTLAMDYFDIYMKTANSELSRRNARLKCKTEYRKLITALNKAINTVQVIQCDRKWSTIDFNTVTSITLSKQKKAFLNVNKKGDTRYPKNPDRIACAAHFAAHIETTAISGNKEMKGKRVSMADFTKQAIPLSYGGYCKSSDQLEKDLLNSQWRDNSLQTGALGKMIAMVDVSGSMEGDPMNVAIALGIRIAEKSVLGQRVLTFSDRPTWVNLDIAPDFVSKVAIVKSAPWGMNTNFHAALKLILDAIVKHKLPSSEVQDMVLVILSDMQIDQGDRCDKQSLYKAMQTMYAEAGMKVCGQPYTPPHILFWNLRHTDGFPNLSNQPNTSMMSGFSPALLNVFCEQGLEALQTCTPWSMLLTSLENKRYDIMGEKISIE